MISKLSVTTRAGICTVALIAMLMVGSFSMQQDAFAFTRGTPYDDFLSSTLTEDLNQDELIGENSTEARTSVNSSGVFIYGDLGNDEIRGSNLSDHLSGGPGSDVIYGNNGGDFIEGGSGIDSLYGGAGDDVLSGGEGADYFDCGEGRDSVDDFKPVEGDFALANCEILENDEKPVTMR
jgi:RTX calcium-binding nonapeptide repeat (4 copies)